MTSIWRAAVCVVLAMPAWAGAEAEPVSLRARWSVGDQRRFDLAVEYAQSGAGENGREGERRLVQNARVALEVAEVDAAGGATVKLTFESLRAEVGGEGEAFEWAAGAADAPPEDDKPSTLALVSRALAGCTLVAVVAGDGSVSSVSGLAPLAGALGQAGEGESDAALRALGFFAPARLKANLAMLWRVDTEGRAREPGAVWRTSERLALGEGREVDVITARTLEGVDGTTARVAATIVLTPLRSGREADPGSPRLEIKEQSGTVRVEWDTAAGALVGRVEERSVVWTAALDLGPGAMTPGLTAESRATSTVRITAVP